MEYEGSFFIMKTSNLQKVGMAEWDKGVVSWTTIDGCIGVCQESITRSLQLQ